MRFAKGRTFLVVATILISLLVGLPAQAADPAPPEFLLKWETPGTGDGQLNRPYGVAIDLLP